MLGFTLIAALFSNNIAVKSWVSRIFVLLIFVRFSLVIVVSLNSIVDNVFISKQITSGAEKLDEFKADLVLLKNSSGNSKIDRAAYEKTIRVDRSKIDEINTTSLPNIKLELTNTNSQLLEAEANLEEIKKQRGWADRFNPFNKDKNVIEAEQRVSINEQKIETLQKSIEEQEDVIEQLLEEIKVCEKRLAGEPVGFWEKYFKWTPSISGLKQSLSLDAIQEYITQAVNNIIQLSVLFILKSILIPLAFLFVLIKGAKGIWNADLTAFFTTEEKLATE